MIIYLLDGILQKTVMSPLHVAVLKGDLNYLNALLREGSLKSLVNLANNDGTTPVHIASSTGQTGYCVIKFVAELNNFKLRLRLHQN